MGRSTQGIRLRFLAFALGGVALPTADALAQAPTTTYTPAQANAGAAVYQARCAMCHLPTLLGTPLAPALTGPVFQNAWGARPVGQLMTRITTSMPPTAAGTLTAEEVTGVVAYLLRANQVSPNGIALTTATVGPVIPGFVPPESIGAPPSGGGASAANSVAPPTPGRGDGDRDDGSRGGRGDGGRADGP